MCCTLELDERGRFRDASAAAQGVHNACVCDTRCLRSLPKQPGVLNGTGRPQCSNEYQCPEWRNVLGQGKHVQTYAHTLARERKRENERQEGGRERRACGDVVLVRHGAVPSKSFAPLPIIGLCGRTLLSCVWPSVYRKLSLSLPPFFPIFLPLLPFVPLPPWHSRSPSMPPHPRLLVPLRHAGCAQAQGVGDHARSTRELRSAPSPRGCAAVERHGRSKDKETGGGAGMMMMMMFIVTITARD